MDLYKEILVNILEQENVEITFTNLTINTEKIIENQCYKALNEIKSIIEDDSLDDKECFMKIEKIVTTLENIGSNGGNRHDFGREFLCLILKIKRQV